MALAGTCQVAPNGRNRARHRLRQGRSLPAAVLTGLICLCLNSAALAQAGSLDATFSSDGRVTTDFTSRNDEAFAVAIQDDGTIVAAGGARVPGGTFALARYTMNGGLDSTFGGDGRVTTNFGTNTDWINSLAIQDDDKIVAVGGTHPRRGNNVRVAVARYETDGSLDTTFGGDGRVVTNLTPGYDYAEDVVLQTDGEIVVVGGAAGAGGRFALVRYETNGALDTTFSGDGKVVTDFNTGEDDATAVVLQADGKIVAAGWSGPAGSNDYRFAVARYETNGALDTTFSGDGRATTNFTPGNDYGWDMALQEDERIVVVGAAAGAGERFALARYTTSGGLDTTFGGDGRVITDLNSGSDVATGVGVQDDGKIVAAGWSGPANSSNYRFAVARYENGGGLDATFGSGGTATTNFTTGNDYAWDMTIQSDGKVVAVGRASGAGGRFALARYTAA
jgi:uncharacterized delta-60 repeat protein